MTSNNFSKFKLNTNSMKIINGGGGSSGDGYHNNSYIHGGSSGDGYHNYAANGGSSGDGWRD